MMMVELTAVPSTALPVAALAEQLRLARGFSDDGSQDATLERCLRAACAAIEARIGKALFSRRFVLTLLEWQSEKAHLLPMAPVGQIEAVRTITRAGVEAVLDTVSYRLQPDRHRPLLVATGARLPEPMQGGSIEVEFTAGFALDWSGIPADLQQAVMILAGEYWGQESAAERGIPLAVAVLLEPHRALRLRGAVQ
jgi:uncharacterized phiE125 gp8 family phage protein